MKQLTEDVDIVSFVIILHEELVAVHYVFGEVPCKAQVKNRSSIAEEWRDNARGEVRPNA